MFKKVAIWFATENRLLAAAILRVGLGTLVISMYLLHYRYRHVIWGPDGFVSHEMFLTVLGQAGSFSVYELAGSRLGFELLFHTGLVVTLLWVLGLYTRLTGLVTYIFAFSLWERNGFILDGGDNILILVLFFLVFARTDRFLAVQNLLRTQPTGQDNANGHWRVLTRQAGTVLHNAALLAIVVQVAFLYLTSGLNKVQGEMWQHGVALYYILRVQEFTLPGVAELVYQHAGLVAGLTYLTVLEQIAWPFMLLNRRTKIVSLFLVVGMHSGIAVLMGLVSFSLTMIILQAATFRDAEYEAVGAWGRRLGRTWFRRGSNTRFSWVPRLARRWVAPLRASCALVMYFDGWCPACVRTARMVERLDWLRCITLRSIRQPGVEREVGKPSDLLVARMHVRSVRSGKVFSGAAAFAVVCTRLPALALVWPLLWTASRFGIGEKMYDRVARRRKIQPDSGGCAAGSCSVP